MLLSLKKHLPISSTIPIWIQYSLQFFPNDKRLYTPDGKYLHRVLGAWGGESLQEQQSALQNGIDGIVCTPGRLIDLLHKKMVSLNEVKVFVLDEADKAVDVEMENQIRHVTAPIDFDVDRKPASR